MENKSNVKLPNNEIAAAVKTNKSDENNRLVVTGLFDNTNSAAIATHLQCLRLR